MSSSAASPAAVDAPWTHSESFDIEAEDPFPAVSSIMHRAVAERIFPGGVVAFGRLGSSMPYYSRGYGTFTFESRIPTTPDSVWDVASLTKVLATTPAVMLLYEEGRIELDAPAATYVPEFGQNGKAKITIRQLMTHTAGLREWYNFYGMGLRSHDEIIDFIYSDKPWYPIGSKSRYSDLSMIVVAKCVERIAGMPLDRFVHERLYSPMGMSRTGFRRVESLRWDPDVVPTEVERTFRHRLLWGEVHDANAYLMGGVAGHAGLFSSASDIARFARMLLAGGVDPVTGARVFRHSTVRLFSTPVNFRAMRSLGWDCKARSGSNSSAGRRMGRRSYGHTGFTGTSLWLDPQRQVFVCVLANAVHPTADSLEGAHIVEVRPAVADAAVEHLVGPPIVRLTPRKMRRMESSLRQRMVSESSLLAAASVSVSDRGGQYAVGGEARSSCGRAALERAPMPRHHGRAKGPVSPRSLEPPAGTAWSTPSGFEEYTVAPGEHVWRVAADRGVTLDEVRRVNPEVCLDVVMAGQVIRLPKAGPPPASPGPGTNPPSRTPKPPTPLPPMSGARSTPATDPHPPPAASPHPAAATSSKPEAEPADGRPAQAPVEAAEGLADVPGSEGGGSRGVGDGAGAGSGGADNQTGAQGRVVPDSRAAAGAYDGALPPPREQEVGGPWPSASPARYGGEANVETAGPLGADAQNHPSVGGGGDGAPTVVTPDAGRGDGGGLVGAGPSTGSEGPGGGGSRAGGGGAGGAEGADGGKEGGSRPAVVDGGGGGDDQCSSGARRVLFQPDSSQADEPAGRPRPRPPDGGDDEEGGMGGPGSGRPGGGGAAVAAPGEGNGPSSPSGAAGSGSPGVPPSPSSSSVGTPAPVGSHTPGPSGGGAAGVSVYANPIFDLAHTPASAQGGVGGSPYGASPGFGVASWGLLPSAGLPTQQSPGFGGVAGHGEGGALFFNALYDLEDPVASPLLCGVSGPWREEGLGQPPLMAAMSLRPPHRKTGARGGGMQSPVTPLPYRANPALSRYLAEAGDGPSVGSPGVAPWWRAVARRASMGVGSSPLQGGGVFSPPELPPPRSCASETAGGTPPALPAAPLLSPPSVLAVAARGDTAASVRSFPITLASASTPPPAQQQRRHPGGTLASEAGADLGATVDGDGRSRGKKCGITKVVDVAVLGVIVLCALGG